MSTIRVEDLENLPSIGAAVSCFIAASLEIRSLALVYGQLLDRITRAAGQTLVLQVSQITTGEKWDFPKIGVPPNHPVWFGIVHS